MMRFGFSFSRFSLWIGLLAGARVACGQSLVLSNVRVEINAERITIRYDADGITAEDSVYVQIESQSRGRLNAATLTGELGRGILPGRNKTIYWNYRLDSLTISDPIRATVSVKRFSKPAHNQSGGPTNALISLLAPGVGSILVQPDRKVGLRPLITGTYAGLMIYGFVQKKRSGQDYDRYADQLREEDYAQANRRHHRYLVATRLAGAVLISDVVYTFLKGRKNLRQGRGGVSSRQIVLSAVGTAPTIGFRSYF